MGADPLSAAIIGGSFLVSSLASYALSPKAPSTDATNYELLMQTQAQANAESEAAKAKIEEAKKREELRQQQLAGQNILTSDSGVDTSKVGVKDQVLGSQTDDSKGSSSLVVQ